MRLLQPIEYSRTVARVQLEAARADLVAATEAHLLTSVRSAWVALGLPAELCHATVEWLEAPAIDARVCVATGQPIPSAAVELVGGARDGEVRTLGGLTSLSEFQLLDPPPRYPVDEIIARAESRAPLQPVPLSSTFYERAGINPRSGRWVFVAVERARS